MEFYVVKGLFKKFASTPKSVIGLESFSKILKLALTQLSVRFNDPCCPLTAINTSATLTAAQVERGYFTSNSTTSSTYTLPSAASFNKQQGETVDFIVDNSAGTGVITVVLGAGMTSSQSLTVIAGAVGKFELIFTSATTAKLVRLA